MDVLWRLVNSPFVSEISRFHSSASQVRVNDSTRTSAPTLNAKFPRLQEILAEGGRNCLLLCRNQIELTGRFFIEKRAIFGIAPAPMLPPTGNSQETARSNTLVAGLILVQIGAFHNNYPNVISVGVHPGVVSWRKLRECGMRSFVRIAPDSGHGDSVAHVMEIRLIGGDKYHFSLRLILLCLHSPDGPCNHQRGCDSNN